MSNGLTNLLDYDAGYLAGVKATRAAMAREEPILTLGGLELDRNTRVLRIADGVIPLTETHFTMLELLMTGRCITVEAFAEALWPNGDERVSYANLVKVHICKLRAKLPLDTIGTRWGVGHFINQEPVP